MKKNGLLSLAFTVLAAASVMGQNVNVSGALTGNGSYATLGAAMSAICTSQSGANIVVDIVGNTSEGTATVTIGAGTWSNLLELRETAPLIQNCSQSLWHVKSAGTLENARGYAAMASGASTQIFLSTEP